MDARRLKRAHLPFGLARGPEGARQGPPLSACRSPAVPGLARPARLHAAALGGDRRRGAGAGHLPLLPGHGRAAAAALRPDRAARRLHHPQSRRCRFRHGRLRLHRRRDAHRRAGCRTASAKSSPGTRICSPAITRTTRQPKPICAMAGCIPATRAISSQDRPSRRHRPHQGPRRDRARRPLLAAIHREQAEILALYRRGGDPRRGPRLSRRDDLHPLLHPVEMGGEAAHRLHHL